MTSPCLESQTQQPQNIRALTIFGVCADVACSCCSCSAGSTRVLGVAVLRAHRVSIARLRPALGPLPGGNKNTCFPSTHHNIQRLQALGVLLRSGSIGLGLTFLARLMVVLRAERGRGVFEVASEKRDARETAEPAPLCIANSAPLQNICMH